MSASPTEGTDMSQIETVAQAICPKCGALSGDDWSQCSGVCPMRQTAIAAMAVQAEPVAWLYEHPDFGSKIPLANRTPDLCNCGWTETPLYAFPTPPAGGSDAE